MNELDYIAYFENLASQHALLRHSPEEKHFFVVSEYSRAEIEQALNKQLKLPCLLLDQYMDDLDTTRDTYLETVMGGITILVKCQKANEADRRRARSEARTIARSIIKRLRKDAQAGGPLYNIGVRLQTEFKGDPAPFALETADGWGYGFEYISPTTVAVNGADWLDLGANP
jgi:hypothetical protein